MKVRVCIAVDDESGSCFASGGINCGEILSATESRGGAIECLGYAHTRILWATIEIPPPQQIGEVVAGEEIEP